MNRWINEGIEEQHLVRELHVGLVGEKEGDAGKAAIQVAIQPPTGCHVQRGLPIL